MIVLKNQFLENQPKKRCHEKTKNPERHHADYFFIIAGIASVHAHDNDTIEPGLAFIGGTEIEALSGYENRAGVPFSEAEKKALERDGSVSKNLTAIYLAKLFPPQTWTEEVEEVYVLDGKRIIRSHTNINVHLPRTSFLVAVLWLILLPVCFVLLGSLDRLDFSKKGFFWIIFALAANPLIAGFVGWMVRLTSHIDPGYYSFPGLLVGLILSIALGIRAMLRENSAPFILLVMVLGIVLNTFGAMFFQYGFTPVVWHYLLWLGGCGIVALIIRETRLTRALRAEMENDIY